MDKDTKILLFDGDCNLCNSTVQFIINRDSNAKIKFASIHSEAGIKLLKQYMLPQTFCDSVVFIDGEKAYLKSSAALRTCLYLSSLWPLLYAFVIIPPFIRNLIYDFIAKRRIKWFGNTSHCWIMKEELKNRFII